MLRSAREERRKAVFSTVSLLFPLFFPDFFLTLFFFSSFIRLFNDLRRCCATTAPKSKTPSHHISASASAHPHRPINQPTTTTTRTTVPVQQVPIWSYVIHSHAVSQTTTPHDPDHDDHTAPWHMTGAKEESSGVWGCVPPAAAEDHTIVH